MFVRYSHYERYEYLSKTKESRQRNKDHRGIAADDRARRQFDPSWSGGPLNRSILKILAKVLANTVVVVGLLLLVRVFHEAATGSLVGRVLPNATVSSATTALALGLALPIPFHVISIGLIVQRRWLPRRLARIAWWAIVTSGCWLGVALAVKWLIL